MLVAVKYNRRGVPGDGEIITCDEAKTFLSFHMNFSAPASKKMMYPFVITTAMDVLILLMLV